MEDHRGLGGGAGGDGEGMIERRSSARKRHIAPRLAVVDDASRKQAATARLEALENDNGAFDGIEDEDDDAYMGEDTELQEVFKQKRAKPKRRTRQARALEKAGAKKKEAKTFADYLEELILRPCKTKSFDFQLLSKTI
ncbi:hypothetical protein CBR_g4734 [Chara braunii]|uniref:Uncharacterized protein n=1 Tax=Chara braunii TaxID=69332 RepID=A0A388KIP6_CHABU|nr:hypothetical protein CBR_g4734 [Chara braunii]|eukprot:GBG69906.1 hypothetical protein CBR_g4734 [Chara braunii]